MTSWWSPIPRFAKWLIGTAMSIFVAGSTITYKAIAYQKEFKAEILEEVSTMRSQDMTLINSRLDNIDTNVIDTKQDVRMIKKHLIDRR